MCKHISNSILTSLNANCSKQTDCWSCFDVTCPLHMLLALLQV